MPAGDPIGLFQAAATMLQDTGFVPVLAERGSPVVLPERLRSRHALIICADAAGQNVAIAWSRALSLASPRRHLIVLFEDRVRPMTFLEPGTPSDDRSVLVRVERAERWHRRGRWMAADRWLLAAVLAARRRGDEAQADQLEVNRACRLVDRDELEEGDDMLRQLLAAGLDWPSYVAAASARTDILVTRGEFCHARAWMASLAAETTLRGVGLPAVARARLAELRFWEGRTLQPAEVRDDRDITDADEIGWRALSAWSSGNLPAVTILGSRLATEARSGQSPAAWWSALIRVLFAGGSDGPELHARIRMLIALNSLQPRSRLRRLAHTIAARAFAERGQTADALAALAAVTGPGPESSAAARLRRSLSTHATPTPPTRARHYPTMPGIDFLALRSTSMELVNGLSGLLSIVEDSEDEVALLAGGCRWVCRQGSARAVAVVSADRGTLVAAEGWKRSDLGGEIASTLAASTVVLSQPAVQSEAAIALGVHVPVRYGGVTIGYVVAKGETGERAGLQQALQAFAALSGSALRARLDALAAPARIRDLIPEIVGDSPLMQAVRDAIARAAAAPFPVLIEGESGTGKELVARALHRLGPRRDRRLCAVNCAALTDDLVEAELFGHTRGAFTGAIGPRAGLFEEASGGTLFFDEVAELSPRAQAKLLRALQEREIRRVGENTGRAVDVRVIAATNTELAGAAAAGRFRDDLRFRLAVVRIRLPSLRDRIEDVASLARVFWRRAAAEAGTKAVLGPDAVARLTRHHWPGNVRELQNVISSLVVSLPGRGRVGARQVDQVLSHAASGDDPVVHLETARRTFERRVIAAALVRHAGRRAAAASELGLTRQGLSKALRRLGLACEHVGEATIVEDAAGVA
jgi:DNA-binding NtrC family response regulator